MFVSIDQKYLCVIIYLGWSAVWLSWPEFILRKKKVWQVWWSLAASVSPSVQWHRWIFLPPLFLCNLWIKQRFLTNTYLIVIHKSSHDVGNATSKMLICWIWHYQFIFVNPKYILVFCLVSVFPSCPELCCWHWNAAFSSFIICIWFACWDIIILFK